MNTALERLTQDQINELQRIKQQIAQAETECAKAEAELEALDVRLFADNRHVFTLLFNRGEMAVVVVQGAPTQYHAHTTISHLFKHWNYSILDGKQTNGCAVGDFRCWYSSAAQEIQPRLTEAEA